MFKFNLQRFAEEKEADPKEEESKEEKEEKQESKEKEGKEKETSEKTEKNSESKTFTQEELDSIIEKRLERERKKYADYDEIKKTAKKYEKELEEKRLAEMSEKERLEEMAKKHEQEKEELAKQLEEISNKAKQEKINNEFIKLATQHHIEYVDDALRLVDLSEVEVDDEGNVKGVEEVVKSLAKEKPYLLKQGKPQPKTVGDSNVDNPADEKTKEQLLKEAAEKAKRSNRPEDKVAYALLKRELGI